MIPHDDQSTFKRRPHQTNKDDSGSLFDLLQMSKAELEDLFLFVVLSEGQSDDKVKQ